MPAIRARVDGDMDPLVTTLTLERRQILPLEAIWVPLAHAFPDVYMSRFLIDVAVSNHVAQGKSRRDGQTDMLFDAKRVASV